MVSERHKQVVLKSYWRLELTWLPSRRGKGHCPGGGCDAARTRSQILPPMPWVDGRACRGAGIWQVLVNEGELIEGER